MPVPVTATVSWLWAPAFRLRVAGVTAREVTLAGMTTVTLAVALMDVDWVGTAVMTSAHPLAGAVYSPVLVMLPFWHFQITDWATRPLPSTATLNWHLPPGPRVWDPGDTVTEVILTPAASLRMRFS